MSVDEECVVTVSEADNGTDNERNDRKSPSVEEGFLHSVLPDIHDVSDNHADECHHGQNKRPYNHHIGESRIILSRVSFIFISESEYKETDENGDAYTQNVLPYGKYIVKETTTPKDYESAADFTFSITEDESEVQDVAKKVKDIVVNMYSKI